MRAQRYIAIVLDRSGSMKKVKDEIISGVNKQIDAILEENNSESDIYVSLVVFDTLVKEEFFNLSADALSYLTTENYCPDKGWTAMRDGVGYTIDKLKKTTDINNEFNSYLIIVVSDGKENQSQFWTEEQLSSEVQSLQKTNRCTFVYIGSNQDLAHVRKTLSFTNVANYNSTVSGRSSAFSENSKNMKRWLVASRDKGHSDNDYFQGKKEI